MKVHELIALLSALDPESPVILQKDAEGNGYSPLSGLQAASYVPETTWSGEVVDSATEGQPCVVLWPVN
jgi:hypothetical protein